MSTDRSNPFVLGVEVVCSQLRGLDISKAYDKDSDVQFYVRPQEIPARVDVSPGIFVTLFPDDAHMPSLQGGKNSQMIKKAVVRIDIDLL